MEQMTQKESKFISHLVSGLYAEPGFSDVEPQDIAAASGFSDHQVAGLISSLQEKGIVEMDDYGFVHLAESHWSLHPEWAAQ